MKSFKYLKTKGRCDFAKKQEMRLEMEWDSRLISNPDFIPKMLGYLDGFEKNGVFEKAAVAHYMGRNEMIHLSKTEKPEIKQIYERLCRILVKRQKSRCNEWNFHTAPVSFGEQPNLAGF